MTPSSSRSTLAYTEPRRTGTTPFASRSRRCGLCARESSTTTRRADSSANLARRGVRNNGLGTGGPRRDVSFARATSLLREVTRRGRRSRRHGLGNPAGPEYRAAS
jgi:hypothetical protein